MKKKKLTKLFNTFIVEHQALIDSIVDIQSWALDIEDKLIVLRTDLDSKICHSNESKTLYKDFSFTNDMTPEQFRLWDYNRSHKESAFYHVYLYSAYAEGKQLEMLHDDIWVSIKEEGNIFSSYCRVKSQDYFILKEK